MDIKTLRQYIANKSPKQTLNESVPPAIQKYKTEKETFGIAYDAGAALSRHPAVEKYLNHIRQTMPTGTKHYNDAYVRANRNLPKDVVNAVAKDYGLDASQIYLMWSAYTAD